MKDRILKWIGVIGVIVAVLLFTYGALFAQAPQVKVTQLWYYSTDPVQGKTPSAWRKTYAWVNYVTGSEFMFDSTTLRWSNTFDIGLFVPGPQGPKGDKGDAGATPTVSVGTTSTLAPGQPARVESMDTPAGVVLNFYIPQGEQGATGPQGPSGGGSGGNPTQVGSVRYVYNASDMQAALTANATGAVTAIEVMQSFGVTSTLVIPNQATSTAYQGLDIDLNGNTIYDASASGLTALMSRKPVDQAQAITGVSWALSLHDGCLKGKSSTSTGDLLYLYGYNCNLYNLRITSAQRGLNIKFGLMTYISNVVSASIGYAPIILDRGDWTNATMFNSQSNHSKVEMFRAFNVTGAEAAIWTRGCSGIELSNIISEGGNPKYHIYMDSQLSSTVKDIRIRVVHLESIGTVAGIYVRGQSMYIDIDGVYIQYTMTLISVEGNGNQVYARHIPWLLSDTKFANTGSGNNWHFSGMIYDPKSILTTARWATTMPAGRFISYWDGSTFCMDGNIKINGTTQALARTATIVEDKYWFKLSASEVAELEAQIQEMMKDKNADVALMNEIQEQINHNKEK